jgi:23S rRNA (pseudouridine1915-N3)-methyltransferase
MRKIKLIAGGKIKNSPFAPLVLDYTKRLKSSLELIEIDVKKSDNIEQVLKLEAEFILSKLNSHDYVIVLDERGKTFSSEQMAEKLQQIDLMEGRTPVFIIGGAEGFREDIRARAQEIWSFGKPTWPHLMVRLMLVEQIYRAEQIQAGHPYHRR